MLPYTMTDKDTWAYVYTPCSNGHCFIWSGGNTGEEVPAGMFCECGKTRAVSEKCDHCGQTRLIAKPVTNEYLQGSGGD